MKANASAVSNYDVGLRCCCRPPAGKKHAPSDFALRSLVRLARSGNAVTRALCGASGHKSLLLFFRDESDDSPAVAAQHGPSPTIPHIELFFAGLHPVVANVRQVTVATFYLFGFVLFWNLQTIGDFADHTKSSMGFQILEDFIFQCFLAASAFFVFLVLHLTQWLVTSRVNACEKRVKGSQEL